MTGGTSRRDAGAATPDVRLLEQAFGQSPSGIAVVAGPEHTLLYSNAAFHDILAADSHGARTGVALPSAFRGTAALAIADALGRARAGRCPWRGVLPAPADGDACGDGWPCAIWALGDGDDGGARSALVVEVDASTVSALARLRFRDLTERVLLSALREEDRADAADVARVTAEQASEARRQLVAALSHDVRTPLQAIGGYVRLFEMGLLGPVSERQQWGLLRIQNAMQHVLGIATGLLAHEHLQAGQVQYAMRDVASTAALDQAVALLQTQADVKGVALRVGRCDESLFVRADPGKLRQIHVNLLGNAVKFTAPGGEVVTMCEKIATDGDDAQVAIRVSDTGPGIALDDLGRVFDPYVQVGDTPSTREAGVGLGLAISRAMAHGMGGTLTVESVVGRGSTFTLSLPRVSAL